MLQNVDLVIEEEPDCEDVFDECDGLFGLYEGIPLTERGQAYHLVAPDKITIYRKTLERAFPEPHELRYQIRVTVLHELSHHVGYDELGVDELGFG